MLNFEWIAQRYEKPNEKHVLGESWISEKCGEIPVCCIHFLVGITVVVCFVILFCFGLYLPEGLSNFSCKHKSLHLARWVALWAPRIASTRVALAVTAVQPAYIQVAELRTRMGLTLKVCRHFSGATFITYSTIFLGVTRAACLHRAGLLGAYFNPHVCCRWEGRCFLSWSQSSRLAGIPRALARTTTGCNGRGHLSSVCSTRWLWWLITLSRGIVVKGHERTCASYGEFELGDSTRW